MNLLRCHRCFITAVIFFLGSGISVTYTNNHILDNNNNNNNNNGYTEGLLDGARRNDQPPPSLAVMAKSSQDGNPKYKSAFNSSTFIEILNGQMFHRPGGLRNRMVQSAVAAADSWPSGDDGGDHDSAAAAAAGGAGGDDQKQQRPSPHCSCDTNDNSNQVVPALKFVPGEAVHDETRTIIFIITPTYTRPTQMADMTRLSQTLRLIPDIFWIVVEDAHNKSGAVEDLLLRGKFPYAHLLGPRPPTHMDKRSGRGVSNRLKAFKWLRENYADTDQPGVIYLADDDNAYDERLFDEMRTTKIVSMFPVGLLSTLGFSTPIVSKLTGKIIGFHDPFIGRRKFAVDMAGFAVNLQYFLAQKKATMPYKVGYEEDYFLKSLDVKIWQLEPKAKNCTEVLVWHTKTKPADWPKMHMLKKVTNYMETNLPLLYQNVIQP